MYTTIKQCEPCGTVYILTYLYKYIYKGFQNLRLAVDRLDRRTTNIDNITQAIDSNTTKFTDDECFRHIVMRCLSACHAVWQIFGYHQFSSSPAVKALSIHLPWRRNIVWMTFGKKTENNLQRAQQVMDDTSSSLQKYFQRPSAEQFDGVKFLEYYNTYRIKSKSFSNKNREQWKDQTLKHRFVAKRMPTSKPTRHRMHSLLPTQGQVYFLRLLLLHFPARYDLTSICKYIYTYINKYIYTYTCIAFIYTYLYTFHMHIYINLHISIHLNTLTCH
jgi:hypothetical protein